MTDVTRILNAIEQGDAQAADELLPLVYEELRRLAAYKMSHEPPGQTLQATALVHEAYIRLVGSEAQSWNSRTHFVCAAADAMRHILTENARRKRRLKRGGEHKRIDLHNAHLAIEEPTEDILALDEALTKLAAKEPAASNLVKLRYFTGLTLKQAAEIMGVSCRTADRYWAYARAWLYKEMRKGGGSDSN
jgi:RNA polymerase sigma factor (TIGR02999 family)